ncbi:unnamed protein product [Clonostachys rosea]|uniref:Fungal N-terminal domain-containing protein n=1 Tax=Bionectria ochroleuca TaxID=29856 RepID=A0ABY6TVX8_BIOOC|nr:unnamed protein product [Clonostachys rosea]
MGNAKEASLRIEAIRNEFHPLESATNGYYARAASEKQKVRNQEDEDRRQIQTAADAAYANLEDAVNRLVELPSSRDEVSDQDPAMVEMVTGAIKKFKNLSNVSQQNSYDLGTATGDCDSFRTVLKNHMDELDQRCARYNMEYQSAWSSCDTYESNKNGYTDKQDGLDRQLSNAIDDRDSVGGWFASRFSDDLDDKVSAARRRVDENRSHREVAENDERMNYKLSMTARNCGSACIALKQRTRLKYDEFGEELTRIREAQKIEARLWRGLLELSNMMEDSSFLSSRDNSLRLVLKVLKADDHKFGTDDRYGDVEERIKAAITDKWGAEGLQNLLVPGPLRGPKGFLAND